MSLQRPHRHNIEEIVFVLRRMVLKQRRINDLWPKAIHHGALLLDKLIDERFNVSPTIATSLYFT
jgi:hypothetical protein